MTAHPAVLVTLDATAPRARQLADALGARSAAAPAPSDRLVLWAEPWTRTTPLPIAGQAVHVLDLHGAVASCPGWGTEAESAWCAAIARLCRGAALLLVGSAAEHGFWSAVLAAERVSAPMAIVPYAAAIAAEPRQTRPRALRIVASSTLNPALRPMLDAALAWARDAGLAVEISPGSRVADRIGAAGLTIVGEGQAPAALLLDLREDTPGERAATPAAVINALAAGVPVFSTVDGALSQAIAEAGAGQVVVGSMAALPPMPASGRAALALARGQFDGERAAGTLRLAVDQALGRSAQARSRWRQGARPPQPLGPDGHVLVLSDETQTLSVARVHLPFGALHRRGAIGGYAVLHRGEVVFNTRPQARGDRFDAIWVHRSNNPEHRLLLEVLGRPFAYDIDDNLLATPAYRDRFRPIARDTAKSLLQSAEVVSCATARLSRLLADRAECRLAERLVITPNLGQQPAPPRAAGLPRALVWASSDRPALTAARNDIVRAVRDHCLAHDVKLVCIGAAPPDGMEEAGVTVEALGLLPHGAYREHLRSLSPAILVCPLETSADAETQDFVDGKSDIKMIEALSNGLVGVFSRANPYLDSDLPEPILCDNTYDGWLAGLEAARAACLAPPPSVDWPEARDSGGFGLAPWAEALARVRLPAPLHLDEVLGATGAVRALKAPALTRDEFDEEYYLANYEDVREDVRRSEETGGGASGYEHYVLYGRAEARFARKRHSAASLGEAWWTTLLHEIGRMERATSRQAEHISALEQRLALRRTLAARGR